MHAEACIAFQRPNPPAVLLPESFRGRLLLRRRRSVGGLFHRVHLGGPTLGGGKDCVHPLKMSTRSPKMSICSLYGEGIMFFHKAVMVFLELWSEAAPYEPAWV